MRETRPTANAMAERERKLVQYLLGTLPPGEQVELEDRYMADDDLHEELLAITDDLIHAYLVGKLSPDERRQFETHLLASPRWRERLEFMRVLLAAIRRASSRPEVARPLVRKTSGWYWPAWAAALLVGTALAAAFLLRGTASSVHRVSTMPRAATTPQPSVPARPSPRPTESPAATQSPIPKRTPVSPVRLVRLPRDTAGPVEIVLSRLTRTVRLEVAVPGVHPSYDVTLRTLQGSQLWRAPELTVESPEAPLIVRVPANVLTAGDFVLSVEGEAVRDRSPSSVTYHLKVVRQRGSAVREPTR
jgi:anti-sigma factor RsiW